jgi:hypothetical protein
MSPSSPLRPKTVVLVSLSISSVCASEEQNADHGTCPGLVPSKSAVVMSPQITMTPAIITAMPGAGKGLPSRIAASIARHRRRARAAVTTPAMIRRTPTASHAQWSVCPARSRAAATPEATSASAVRSHARYVRSFASWNCGSGFCSLMSVLSASASFRGKAPGRACFRCPSRMALGRTWSQTPPRTLRNRRDRWLPGRASSPR